MPTDENPVIPKIFCCDACGWILGESYREEGKRITQLRVYRHSRAVSQGLDLRLIPPFVKYSEIKVNDGSPLCEHCGFENKWYANQDAMSEMLKRKSRRNAEVME